MLEINSEGNKTKSLIGALNKACVNSSIDDVITALNQVALTGRSGKNRKIIGVIMYVVSEHYQVPINNIKKSNKRGVTTKARAFCGYFMYNLLDDTSYQDIAVYFGRSKTVFGTSIPYIQEVIDRSKDKHITLSIIDKQAHFDWNILNEKINKHINNGELL